MKYNLSLTTDQFKLIKNHLFPRDGKEAVAIALCGRAIWGNIEKLIVHEILLIPYEQCTERSTGSVSWSTSIIEPLIEKAMKYNFGVLKIHSHPSGYNQFSKIDDISDGNLFNSVHGWTNSNGVHASAVLLPNDEVFGRVIDKNGVFKPINKIQIVGLEVKIQTRLLEKVTTEDFSMRNAQTFGNKTLSKLKQMKIGVVGCSGTGSITVEQLARLGIGELVLVDPDIVESKNLNRILNSTMKDVLSYKYKVDVLKNSINEIGIGTKVFAYTSNLYDDKEALAHLSVCDFIFGCMDSIDGRHLLNNLTTFYSIPYIDMGVKLVADGNGGIESITGGIHYLQPGKSSLLTRGVYTAEKLRATFLKKENPEKYKDQLKRGYIVNIDVDSPAVIHINMLTSSISINEFLARIHDFRIEPNKNFAVTRFSLENGFFINEEENKEAVDVYLKSFIGRGNCSPFLNIINFSNETFKNNTLSA